MSGIAWLPPVLFLIDWSIRLGMTVHIVMRRRSLPASLAWLVVVLFIPVAGAIAYLLIGENRLGRRRLARYERTSKGLERDGIRLWRHRSEEWTAHEERYRQISRLSTAVGGMPPLRGNTLALLTDNDEVLGALIRDIDAAESHCHLLFYIWVTEGLAGKVNDALVRAAERGVECRVLVDAVGSKRFLRSEAVRRMRRAGVRVVAALPVNPVRMLIERLDLRNHRKIAVIDGRVAYTGSQNLADSSFTSTRWRESGPWLDAMVRVEGPAAQALAVVFLQDWLLDAPEVIGSVEAFLPDLGVPEHDESVVQVVPSGPGAVPEAIHQALLTTIYTAREELVMTTPYFVPDEATRMALRAAAMRGVSVTVVVPRRLDAPLVAAAGRSYYLDLLEAGVRIMEFRDGLLHAKTVTVDRSVGLIGSANFDMRSFWLNFEITLFVYDTDFASMLRFAQTGYMAACDEVSLKAWRRRPAWRRATENAAQLLAPLL